MTGGRQYDICKFHAIGHHDIATRNKEILSLKRSNHLDLVRVRCNRIVVVDEYCLDRRIKPVIEQVSGDIHDVQRPGSLWNQVRTLQTIRCFWDDPTWFRDDTGTNSAVISRQCLQRHRSSKT